jgi:hypothetical protein
MVFLGPKLILAEYAGGVVLSIALGLFVLFRGHSFWQVALGMYLMSLGVNYVPMLAYAVAIGSRQRAHEEIADELIEKRRAMSKYRRQALLLLVPLAAPILAVAHGRSRSRQVQSGSE